MSGMVAFVFFLLRYRFLNNRKHFLIIPVPESCISTVCKDCFSAEFQRDAGSTLALSYTYAMVLDQHYPNLILPILNIFVFWERNCKGFILLSSLVMVLDKNIVIFSKETPILILTEGKAKKTSLYLTHRDWDLLVCIESMRTNFKLSFVLLAISIIWEV